MDTVKNPSPDVFERWSEAIEPLVGKGNYAMDMTSKIAKAPYARIFMMGNPGTAWDLEGDECATSASFQVESFASGKRPLSSVYKIDDASHKVMTEMGFRRTYGPELINNDDPLIRRVISRYQRIFTGFF